MAYRASTAAEAFGRILAGEEPRVAVGDFLDDWRRSETAERPELISDPIALDRVRDDDQRRWAAFFAAMVELLAWTNEGGRLPAPTWTRDPSLRLAEPWFLIPGWPLRAYQLFTTPVPFRRRNIFGGEDLLARV